MGRWTPDAQGRLREAALALYRERGFEQATVSDIAERAGVTERTFFRHFADKREVLFAGSEQLQEAVVAAILAAPADATPFQAAAEGVAAAGRAIQQNDVDDFPRQRAGVIAANASLQERELLKLSRLAAGAAQALRDRGIAEPAASLAAQTALGAFHVAFQRWVDEPGGCALDARIAEALDGVAGLLRS
ncbi:helix-turn-helix domain-containing protein [Leifsonia sp. NPDC080035]|uniref:Helix-turn-helix domain-containing protein n=1 Tax=Leifsonia sp. NPDC080035 TaxID=3143936 RepID=A0AAU7GEZ3_9MICO